MSTTQSEDPNEQVAHPRHYNQHPSGVECIELIEHLPANLALAVKYIWRCGLKATSTPLRDLQSAKWYTEREEWRIRTYELDRSESLRTAVVWRALARRVVEKDNEVLGDCLKCLLNWDLAFMIVCLNDAIASVRRT